MASGVAKSSAEEDMKLHYRRARRRYLLLIRFSSADVNSCSALRSASCHRITTNHRCAQKNTVSADGRHLCAISSPAADPVSS